MRKVGVFWNLMCFTKEAPGGCQREAGYSTGCLRRIGRLIFSQRFAGAVERRLRASLDERMSACYFVGVFDEIFSHENRDAEALLNTRPLPQVAYDTKSGRGIMHANLQRT
jgi:hypothetical protein